jgi:16S rRNA (guanine966-N2)-methyltransferase
VRITGGEFRSRKLIVPDGDRVRPTSDKMRQVIFNMLQKYGLPDDGAVIDVFCGTGALGLEALSRGACFCTFIDQSRESLDFCRRNVDALKVADRAALLNRDSSKAGKRDDKIPAAGLAFLDPPYRKNLVAPALAALHDGGWLAPGAVCVAETEEEASGAPPGHFGLLDSRAHGGTKIWFYRYEG